MRLSKHVLASVIISALVWWWLRSLSATLACFLAGVFLDLDHIIDFLYNRRRPFKISRFLTTFEFDALENILVLLHAWEFALIWLALMLCVPEVRQPLALGLFIGFVTHLGLDNIFNRHSRWAYFLLYRLRHGFIGKYYYGAGEYRKRRRYARRA